MNIAVCLLLLLWMWPAQAQLPARIVSMNVCTDQLLLQLVERSRLLSLSHFAADPAWSTQAAAAQGIANNRGRVEEIVALAPDLVLTSAFSATFAANVLQRLHYRVERLGFANSRREVYAQIEQVAAWTGNAAAAKPLVAVTEQRINAVVASLSPSIAGGKALFLNSNGIAYGSGTLQDDFLQSLGLRNVAAELGLSGPASLQLELLLLAAPDFIISEPRGALDRQLAHPFLQHPALARLQTRQLTLPERWFDCAGPALADAYESLEVQLGAAP